MHAHLKWFPSWRTNFWYFYFSFLDFDDDDEGKCRNEREDQNIPFLSPTVLDTSSHANSFILLNTEQLLSYSTVYFLTASANFFIGGDRGSRHFGSNLAVERGTKFLLIGSFLTECWFAYVCACFSYVYTGKFVKEAQMQAQENGNFFIFLRLRLRLLYVGSHLLALALTFALALHVWTRL